MTAEHNRTFAANFKLDVQTPTKYWVSAIADELEQELLDPPNRIIMAPPLPLLALVAEQVEHSGFPIAVAAQDLDPQAETFYRDAKGVKHTGQAYVPQLIADYATHVILGHSETRMDKGLTEDDVNRRLDVARKYGLTPIVCVANVPQAVAISMHDAGFPGIIAYEPLGNIGTTAADPAEANVVCHEIARLYPNASILYGGSVDVKNIVSFLAQPAISGVLIGNRSSNIEFFQGIIREGSTVYWKNKNR